MRTRLPATQPLPNDTTLDLQMDGPAFTGQGPDDFLCSGCGKVLLGSTDVDQVKQQLPRPASRLVLKCKCGAHSLPWADTRH